MAGEMERVDQLLAELQTVMSGGAQPPPTAERSRPSVGPAPEQRGFLLPLRVPRGGYQTDPGTWARFVEGLAVPGIIHDPVDAASQLLSPAGQYRPGTEDAEGVALALQAAGIGGAGALATRPANALTAGIARRSRRAEQPDNALTTRRGLPTDLGSRMSRAQEMGFDTSERMYHGTNRSFPRFSLARAQPEGGTEKAVWLTPDPEVAGHFGRRWSGDLEETRSGVSVLPLYARGRQRVVDREYLEREYGAEFRNMARNDPEYVSPIDGEPGTMLWDPEMFAREMARARRDGYDSVRFARVDEGMGAPADQIAVLDPANVRSTNARFNPRYSRSANLLSANAPPAALPALLPAEHD